MSENEKNNVDANSREFTRGVEAGLSFEGTKYWQAGYEIGQALSDKESKEPVKEIVPKKPDTPLFLQNTLKGQNGDAQDEKDKSTE